jgi:hypothetical protein
MEEIFFNSPARVKIAVSPLSMREVCSPESDTFSGSPSTILMLYAINGDTGVGSWKATINHKDNVMLFIYEQIV